MRLFISPVGVPSGTEHRPGWRRLARLFESQLFSLPPTYEPSTEKIRPRARCRSVLEDWSLFCKGRWRQLVISKEAAWVNTFSLPHGHCPRAWGKFFRFNSSLKRGISLLRRGAHPQGVLLACRWKTALSARWRILAKQLTLFRQYPTPAVARGAYFGRPRGFQPILLTQNG